MVLHRANGEKEDLRDLDVRVAKGEQLRDLKLPGREIADLPGLARGRLNRRATRSRVLGADRRGLVRAAEPRSGSQISTCVPLPGALWTRHHPPAMAARSRMEASPI